MLLIFVFLHGTLSYLPWSTLLTLLAVRKPNVGVNHKVTSKLHLTDLLPSMASFPQSSVRQLEKKYLKFIIYLRLRKTLAARL